MSTTKTQVLQRKWTRVLQNHKSSSELVHLQEASNYKIFAHFFRSETGHLPDVPIHRSEIVEAAPFVVPGTASLNGCSVLSARVFSSVPTFDTTPEPEVHEMTEEKLADLRAKITESEYMAK